MLALSCGSGVAYRDVGEGHEQDEEAFRRESRRGRRSHSKIYCNDWVKPELGPMDGVILNL